ncbi:MAG: hypothetical protein ABUT20_11380 [Bacteroidota bacterium]
MVTKAKIVDFFSKGKVIFATVAAVITFSITMYNQFKTSTTTEISGFVSSSRDNIIPVDAIVKISSPIQGQTETDAQGRFKFKFDNIRSDTFLLIIQNKKTNTETKQNEYIEAGRGKKDIFVLFNSSINDGRVYSPLGKSNGSRKAANVIKTIEQFIPKRR